MELSLKDKDNKYSDDFLYWLLKTMDDLGVLSINYDKLEYIQEGIHKIDKYANKDFNIIQEIVDGLSNLCWRRYGNNMISITIDSTVNSRDLGAKLYVICKLVNYGNIYFRGYPIFTDLFKYVKANIDDLYEMYMTNGWR